METRPLKKIGGLLAAALMAFVIVGCREIGRAHV